MINSGILTHTFSALKHKNYRLWFWSQMFSFLGTWMQITALAFLLYELTGDKLMLGYLAMAGGVPNLLLMVYGGVLSDRYSRRIIIMLAETFMMLVAMVLATLIFTNTIQSWHILAAAFLLGIANAFDVPARQSFVAELVSKADMGNAIALNAAMFNVAVALGPGVGGLLYAQIGPAWCFAINAVSFSGVLVSLFFMRDLNHSPKQPQKMFQALGKTLKVIGKSRDMQTILVSMVNGVMFGFSLYQLFPSWAVEVLHGDARTNGLLQSARGAGALAASLVVAYLGRFRMQNKVLAVAMFAYPLMLIGFSFTTVEVLSYSLMMIAGIFQISLFNSCNIMINYLAPDDQRGTIMGLYNMLFSVSIPLGSLLSAWLAVQAGLHVAFLATASLCLVLALVIQLNNRNLSKQKF